VKWATAEHFLPEVLGRLCRAAWPANVLINVNFPDVVASSVAGTTLTRQGRRKIGDHPLVEGRDPRGEAYYWVGAQRSEDRGRPGTDMAAVDRGRISITPLVMDLTHAPTLRALKGVFP
jgi:5'-nucleotidase